MAVQDLTGLVDARLKQGKSGAHGWFAITRVHLDAASLSDCARYLADRGADQDFVELSAKDYQRLGQLVGNVSGNPKDGLNRHQLLALHQPLGFVERQIAHSVNPIRLSKAGVELANAAKPEDIFEEQLKQIVFCRQPYYTAKREAEYEDYGVKIYPATLAVMTATGGWIDRDEFDLFVSRIRALDEVAWAIDGIRRFRQLTADEKAAVLARVRLRGNLTNKVYQNWRDMGLHGFSLFALGASVVRTGHVLALASVSVEAKAPQKAEPKGGGAKPPLAGAPVKPAKVLRIPEPPAPADIGTEPPAPISNDGRGGEIYVGKLMAASGWRVVYFSHRRGYGFDIWASKGKSVLYVEVKSCTTAAGTLTFTPNELLAAKQYKDNFLLVVVENLATPDQRCWAVQDPAANLGIVPQKIESHKIPAAEWRKAAKAMDI